MYFLFSCCTLVSVLTAALKLLKCCRSCTAAVKVDGAIQFAIREGLRAPYRLSKESSLDIIPPISECFIAIEQGDLLHAKKLLNDLAALLVGSRTRCLDEVMLELKFRESRGMMLRQANRIRRAGANLKDKP
jgi:hypothetical protein